MKIRLEYHSNEENSHKFWMVTPHSKGSWKITWGRVGSDGKSQCIDTNEATKRVREKLKKGYQIHSDSVLEGEIVQLFPFGVNGVKVANTVLRLKDEQKQEQPAKISKKEKEEKDLWEIMINSTKKGE